MKEAEGEMKLTKGYEVDTVNIQRLECTEAVRTIGVRICPSGQQQTEYRYRLHQTREFAKKLRGSRMSRSLAIRAYKTIYIPMIAYPLGASTLTERQLRKLHSIVEQAYLPKGGLNRKFPKAVLRGPMLYGGHGDSGLYTRKGHNKIQLLIGHKRNRDEQGDMLRMEVEALQILAGTEAPIMEESKEFQWIKLVEDTWVKDVKMFLTTIKAGIKIFGQWLLDCH